MKEHCVEDTPPSKDQSTGMLVAHGSELVRWLDSKANQGWRLVAVVEDHFGTRTHYFEREIPYP